MTTDSTTLRRPEIRSIFRRSRGAQAAIARELGVSAVSITQWLKGRVDSKRIAEAMQAKALALLAEEQGRAGDAA
jgi:DNA-binding transcriptional regulator YdaS (Cro superfamily)